MITWQWSCDMVLWSYHMTNNLTHQLWKYTNLYNQCGFFFTNQYIFDKPIYSIQYLRKPMWTWTNPCILNQTNIYSKKPIHSRTYQYVLEQTSKKKKKNESVNVSLNKLIYTWSDQYILEPTNVSKPIDSWKKNQYMSVYTNVLKTNAFVIKPYYIWQHPHMQSLIIFWISLFRQPWWVTLSINS